MPYDRATAKLSELYYRRPLQGGGEKLIKAPYNLIQYEDGSSYVEPVALIQQNPNTWAEVVPESNDGEPVVIDGDPYAGVTEIR